MVYFFYMPASSIIKLFKFDFRELESVSSLRDILNRTEICKIGVWLEISYATLFIIWILSSRLTELISDNVWVVNKLILFVFK